MDGRFDLVALHAWLVLERLKAAGMDAAAQALTDILFVGFDEALREQGTGDMGMGRRMKAFANAFFGRLAAYGGATDEADAGRKRWPSNVWRGARGGRPRPRAGGLCDARARVRWRGAILPMAYWISGRCPP